MTCNITQSPLYPEPLPLYSRHDPDAVSIHSAAPSYVSDTPSYTSRRLSNAAPAAPSLLPPRSSHEQTRGLPAARYAPGFESRAHGSVADINNYNVPSWSSTRTSHNSRQYEAVARRRANRSTNITTATTAMLNSLSAVPPTISNNESPNASSTTLDAYPVNVGSSSEPANPHEDPYLVGEEAARRARTQRVYREMCLREDAAMKYDSRSWDFMLAQMADWEDRDQSWRNYRARVGQTKLLSRRLGFRS